MKAHLKTTVAGRFALVFALLLAAAVWGFSISAAQQAEEKSTEQTAVNPAPAPAAGDAQQAQPTAPATDQAAAPQAAEQTAAPQTTDQTATAQLPAETGPQADGTASSYPPEYIPLMQKTAATLLAANFTFIPVKALDPFVPFVSLDTSGQPRSPGEEDEPQGGPPLTPLQKMTLSEIERGLKAITWGALGSRAVIEDSTGRGYIVAVGTPAGEHGGVIKQILEDRLVIQQEIWDRRAKKRFPQDFTIKLVKKTDAK